MSVSRMDKTRWRTGMNLGNGYFDILDVKSYIYISPSLAL